jgi:hypothetical protein
LGTATCSTVAPSDKQTVSFTLSKSDFGFTTPRQVRGRAGAHRRVGR